MRILIHKDAEKVYDKLDKISKERIKKGIAGLTEIPPVGDIKNLKGEFTGLKRLRIGDFRIIYQVLDDIIRINNILPRGSAYKN